MASASGDTSPTQDPSRSTRSEYKLAKEDVKQHVVIDIVTAWAGTIGYGDLAVGEHVQWVSRLDLGRGKGVRSDEALRPAQGKPSSLGASDSPHASTMSVFASGTAALAGPPGFSRTMGGSIMPARCSANWMRKKPVHMAKATAHIQLKFPSSGFFG